ncbi:hypothetical protein ACFE04_026538 [Oxalis oulophora]
MLPPDRTYPPSSEVDGDMNDSDVARDGLKFRFGGKLNFNEVDNTVQYLGGNTFYWGLRPNQMSMKELYDIKYLFVQDGAVDDVEAGGIKDNDKSIGDDVGFDGDDENDENLDEEDLENVSFGSDEEDDERTELIQNAKSFENFVENREHVLESIRQKAPDQTVGGESDGNYFVETNYMEDPDCNWSMDEDEEVVSRKTTQVNGSDVRHDVNGSYVCHDVDPGNNADGGNDADGSAGEVENSEHIQRFKIDLYKELYSHQINPMESDRFWKHRVLHPLVPPPIRKKMGRPRMKRLPEDGEGTSTKVSRKGCIMRCGFCRKTGHRQNACPDKTKKLKELAELEAAADLDLLRNSGLPHNELAVVTNSKPMERVSQTQSWLTIGFNNVDWITKKRSPRKNNNKEKTRVPGDGEGTSTNVSRHVTTEM